MGGLSLVSVFGVVFSPFVGILIDRWGSRRIALPGVLLFCMSVGGLSLASPSIISWWLLWALVAIASLTLKPTVWSAAVSAMRSEEHTSELQSIMRISYAVFCLQTK